MSRAKPPKPTRPAPRPFVPEVRERAIRLVVEYQAEHQMQWAAIRSIAERVGCFAEALRTWIRRIERDTGQHPGLSDPRPD